MNTIHGVAVVAMSLSMALALALMPAAAGDPPVHGHGHGHGQHQGNPSTHADPPSQDTSAAQAQDTRRDGQLRWTPDPPLRQGMSRVRKAMAALAHHPAGHLAPEDVPALVAEIDDAIAYMFANCRLDPEPDVALHGLLARLMAGTAALRSNPADAAPVADMRAAVEEYGRLFDDPEGTGTAEA